jgi:hypothetical protein
MTVSARAVATKLGTPAQVERALSPSHRVALIARGSRAHGSWGIDETDRSAAAQATRGLYAVGPIHLTGHRYLQLRATADFTGPCSDADVRRGAVPAALERIVRDGRFTGA